MRITVIEDNVGLAHGIAHCFVDQGHAVNMLHDGQAGLDFLLQEETDIIVLDINLPTIDGLTLLKRLRASKIMTPVILLTARGEVSDRVRGLDAGADDYIQKPIRPKVLVSKIKALLRRRKADTIENEPVRSIGELEINREEYKVINKGKELILPRKEFELLLLLTSKPGKVFKRESILEKVWGAEVVVGSRTIDVHIRKLREKIGDVHFTTIKGVGYKFIP